MPYQMLFYIVIFHAGAVAKEESEYGIETGTRQTGSQRITTRHQQACLQIRVFVPHQSSLLLASTPRPACPRSFATDTV